jgi:hypothetical protein
VVGADGALHTGTLGAPGLRAVAARDGQPVVASSAAWSLDGELLAHACGGVVCVRHVASGATFEAAITSQARAPSPTANSF